MEPHKDSEEQLNNLGERQVVHREETNQAECRSTYTAPGGKGRNKTLVPKLNQASTGTYCQSCPHDKPTVLTSCKLSIGETDFSIR